MYYKVLFILITGAALAWNEPAEVYAAGFSQTSDQISNTSMDAALDEYDAVLKEYVDDKGLVNYQQLKAHSKRLDAFLTAVAGTKKTEYDIWSENDKIAFWINAYNVYTLKTIIKNYPIKSGFFASLRYPKNSIRQISGVWDKLKFDVTGKKMTLDHIEHNQLRAKFKEPRIHMALVCAALGCPPLRNEAYRGEKLNAQLDDQSKKFMSHNGKFKIDRTKNMVYLSKIFDWFGEDFVKKFKPEKGFTDHKDPQRASLNFAGKHLSQADAEYLRDKKYKIKYLDYDWSLNEQKKK